MKKILMGSIVLTALSMSIIAFQLSCSKTANAQTGTTSLTQLNLVLYSKVASGSPGETFWTCNLDGSNQKQIPIVVPTGLSISGQARLTPDGKTIVLEMIDFASGYDHVYLYSCSIDGTNLKKIVDAPKGTANYIGGIY